MNFGKALESLLEGKTVRRSGWNGKGMWLVYVPGSFVRETRSASPYYNTGRYSATIEPHIDMFTAQGTMQPGWSASQQDMLASDWELAA
jgi:hypothetical protein